MTYNHDRLRWQWEYNAKGLFNRRIQFCETCIDTPQIQLLTPKLPPDPLAIQYATPEDYTTTDNPISGIGYSAQANFQGASQTLGANIGTLLNGGGLNAAFDGASGKRSKYSATVFKSIAGLNNFLGKNRNSPITSNTPAAITTTISYSVASFAVYGPSDAPMVTAGSTVLLQGSSDGVTWVTLYSTTSQGTNGEVITSISSNLTTGGFQQHRVAIAGDGTHPIYVAQVQFNVATTGVNEQ
jgi:hypothetical protein